MFWVCQTTVNLNIKRFSLDLNLSENGKQFKFKKCINL